MSESNGYGARFVILQNLNKIHRINHQIDQLKRSIVFSKKQTLLEKYQNTFFFNVRPSVKFNEQESVLTHKIIAEFIEVQNIITLSNANFLELESGGINFKQLRSMTFNQDILLKEQKLDVTFGLLQETPEISTFVYTPKFNELLIEILANRTQQYVSIFNQTTGYWKKLLAKIIPIQYMKDKYKEVTEDDLNVLLSDCGLAAYTESATFENGLGYLIQNISKAEKQMIKKTESLLKCAVFKTNDSFFTWDKCIIITLTAVATVFTIYHF